MPLIKKDSPKGNQGVTAEGWEGQIIILHLYLRKRKRQWGKFMQLSER